MADACPDENVLTQMLEGGLGERRLDALHGHVDGCARCSALLLELGHVASPEPESQDTDETGPRLGRYKVLGVLGRGGMGTVYSAFDPALDRRIALKTLHVGNERAQERLLREARAMARLSHPNVVQVHEVATFDGGWFVAMELIEGGTLLSWSQGRPWRVRLRACLDAGRGLAAAHDSGLVHRDFKPSNVLCDAQGQARVTDFGLVAERTTTVDDDAEPETRVDGVDEVGRWDTRTGEVLGTPAYMSPEQARGDPVDERSDQYSFCVTVWQVLSGEHPFGGRTPGTSPPHWSEQAPRVRRGVREALRRGLSASAGDRWPSMSELLRALERSSRPPRWPWLLVPAVGLLSWGVLERYQQVQIDRGNERCEAEGDEIDQLWDTAAQENVRTGLAGAGAPYAESVSSNVSTWLDARAERWRTQAAQACRQAEVLGHWDPSVYERARWCLEEQRLEFEMLLEDFASADARIAVAAVHAAAAPPRLSACDDEAFLGSMSPVPADSQHQRLADVRRSLVRARMLVAQRRFEPGLEAARRARAGAEANGLSQVALAAKATEASHLYLAGDYAASESLARATYLDATRRGDWDIAARAAETLLVMLGVALRRHEEAELWADLAGVAIERAGDPLGLREARRRLKYASTLRAAGQLEDAERNAAQSLEAIEAALGPRHPWTADGLVESGSIAFKRGQFVRSRELEQRALEIREDNLGVDHPFVGNTLAALGVGMAMQGERDAARVVLERARGILEAVPGLRTSDLPLALRGLAALDQWSGDSESAGRLHRRILELDVERFGPDHPNVGKDLLGLGSWHTEREEYPEARRHFERALAIAKLDPRTRGSTIAGSLFNLGLTYQGEERFEEAATRYREALRAIETHMGSEHPLAAYALTGLGISLGRVGKRAEAIEYLERALRLRTDSDEAVDRLAYTQFALAEVLWDAAPDQGRDRKRALDLAQAAAAGYAARPEDSQTQLAELQAWLRDKNRSR